MKHRSKSGQRAIASNFAEVALGFEHTRGGPAQNHACALPAFDAPRDLTPPG